MPAVAPAQDDPVQVKELEVGPERLQKVDQTPQRTLPQEEVAEAGVARRPYQDVERCGLGAKVHLALQVGRTDCILGDLLSLPLASHIPNGVRDLVSGRVGHTDVDRVKTARDVCLKLDLLEFGKRLWFNQRSVANNADTRIDAQWSLGKEHESLSEKTEEHVNFDSRATEVLDGERIDRHIFDA